MPAPSFLRRYCLRQPTVAPGFQPDYTADEAELPVDDLLDLEIEPTEPASFQQSIRRRTTDLVRLYLQEIGRVQLLKRDEEVSEAQKFSVTCGCWNCALVRRKLGSNSALYLLN